VSDDAPPRWEMVIPWAAGFVAYQLINPGGIARWASGWTRVQGWLHFVPQSWMSASALSFLIAAVVTVVVGTWRRTASPRLDPQL
jgi:hypothetical protein